MPFENTDKQYYNYICQNDTFGIGLKSVFEGRTRPEMILTVDIGNTNIKLGGFKDDKLIFTSSVACEKRFTADQYACVFSQIFSQKGVSENSVECSIISSVVPPVADTVKSALKKITSKKVLTVCTGTKTGLFIKMENPSRLGSDFVCAAVGALQKVEAPCVVFDFGTAVTVTAIDSSKALIGTAIMPGVSSSVQSLWQNTAQLPMISLHQDANLLGKNTQDSMRAGALYGAGCAVDGLYRRYRKLLGDETKLILTGGDAHLISKYCESDFILDDHLILRGLYKICLKNL